MKRLLVVVDYQKDFVDGSLGFNGAELIENNIIDLIKDFRANGDEVVFTMDTHHENYMDTIEGNKLPVLHCIKDSEGWKLTDGLQPLVGDSLVFEKKTFGSLDLGKYVENHKDEISEIFLCGLVSSICVFANAVVCKTAAKENTPIKVVRNATSSYDLETQEMSFKILNHIHIDVI